jgi:hypothetical protein
MLFTASNNDTLAVVGLDLLLIGLVGLLHVEQFVSVVDKKGCT